MPSTPFVRRPSSFGLFAVLTACIFSLLMVEESAGQNQTRKCSANSGAPWNNCEGSRQYSDGSYSGFWRNGKFHGYGTLSRNNGQRYQGNFNNGVFHGHGILIENTLRYEGNFQDGKFHGHGSLQLSNGGSYEGSWENGAKHGKGIWIAPDKSRFEGDFKFDRLDGHMVAFFPDGRRYEGQVRNGEFDGQGTYRFPNGSIYTGMFSRGVSEGRGKIVFADRSEYEGEFRQNNIDGRGTYIFTDRTKLTGNFVLGKAQGAAEIVYQNGGRYSGNVRDNIPEGRGKAVFNNGVVFEGDFRSGVADGNGVAIYPDGNKYEGSVKNNKREGYGVMRNRFGAILSSGFWKDDNLVQADAITNTPRPQGLLVGRGAGSNPSPIEFQIEILTSVKDAQSELYEKAAQLEKLSIERTLAIVKDRLEALMKELEQKPNLNTGYLTRTRPDNANSYITARRASELYPKIPYYIPGTRETGEFWIEPVVSKVGEMTFALKFVDVGSTAVEKVRGQIDMTLSETEEAQKALFKLHDWSKTAREQRIRTNFEKRVTCFPASDCPPEGERVEGKASTEIGFLVFEDGSTGGRIQRNKGRFVEAYSVSIDSALLLQAYLAHVIKEAKLEFQAGTQDRRSLQELFR